MMVGNGINIAISPAASGYAAAHTPAADSVRSFSHTSPLSTASPGTKRPFASTDHGIGTSNSNSPTASATPGPKKLKARRACDYCKTKKLRCSGTIPCSGCLERALHCEYTASYRRGRAPTPIPATEDAINAARRYSQASPGTLYGQQTSAPAGGPVFTHEQVVTMTNHSNNNHNNNINNNLHNDASTHTSRNSPELDPSEVDGQYLDQTSNLGFLHRAWRRLSRGGAVSGNTTLPQVQQNLNEQHQRLTSAGEAPFASSGFQPVNLPHRSRLLDMISFYFENCVVTYRCLHQGIVVQWAQTLCDNVESARPCHDGIGHARASVVVTILAVVTLRQDKIQNNKSAVDVSHLCSMGDAFFCLSASLTGAETGLPTLASVQARILQVLYLLQTTRMNQAWYEFGSLVPIVSALGLHRRAPSSFQHRNTSHTNNQNRQYLRPRDDYILTQCRKRTFWVCYTIDKYLAVVFGRPRLYHDDDINQDFPDCVNDEDMNPDGPATDDEGGGGHNAGLDCHIDSLIAHAKLAQLIDRISCDVYSVRRVPKRERLAAAHRLGAELHAWHQALPSHLGTVRVRSLIPPFRRQACALKLAYCHAVMHVNRPFLLGAATLSAAQRDNVAAFLQKTRDVADLGPLGAGSRGSSSAPKAISAGGSGTSTTTLQDSISECLGAAKIALELVNSLSEDGALFHAYWWTPYATFCALAVVYVWEIQNQQQSRVGQSCGGGGGGDVVAAAGQGGDRLQGLLDLAQRCQRHLSRSTSTDSPSHRYSVILEELRKEARPKVDGVVRQQPAAAGVDTGASTSVGVVDIHGNTSAFSMHSHQVDVASMLGDGMSPSQMGQQDFSAGGAGLFVGGGSIFDGWQTTDWMDLDSSVSVLVSLYISKLPIWRLTGPLVGIWAISELHHWPTDDADDERAECASISESAYRLERSVKDFDGISSDLHSGCALLSLVRR